MLCRHCAVHGCVCYAYVCFLNSITEWWCVQCSVDVVAYSPRGPVCAREAEAGGRQRGRIPAVTSCPPRAERPTFTSPRRWLPPSSTHNDQPYLQLLYRTNIIFLIPILLLNNKLTISTRVVEMSIEFCGFLFLIKKYQT